MAKASNRGDVFEITKTTLILAVAPKSSSGMLHPASSDPTRPTLPPFAKGSLSAQGQVVQEECEETVDWETIAAYLSRCQLSHTPLSPTSTITSNLPPPTHLLRNPPQRELRRRSPAGVPPSMNKTPSNPPPQSATPPPSPTAMASSSGLSTGAKAAIAGGAAVGIVILLAGLVAFHTHHRRKRYGYRTKGRDGTSSADFTGHFAPKGHDKGEEMQMLYRENERNTGLGIEITRPGSIGMGGGQLSPEFERGNHTTPLINPEYNVSKISQADYQVSPTMESHRMYNSPSLRPRSATGQTYNSQRSTPRVVMQEEAGEEFDQHNQRSRPSHPLSGLSEAIPPPPLQKRVPHEMADYQSAVPLGFANGFVQVEHVGEPDPVSFPSPNPTSHTPNQNQHPNVEQNSFHATSTGHAVTGNSHNNNNYRPEQAETRTEIEMDLDDSQVDEDEILPVYEENPAVKAVVEGQEKVFRRRNDDDVSDSESEEERRFETHLTKSDLG